VNRNRQKKFSVKPNLACASENLIRSKRVFKKERWKSWFIVLNVELRTKMVPSFAHSVVLLCMRRKVWKERLMRDASGQEKEGLQKNVFGFLMEEKF